MRSPRRVRVALIRSNSSGVFRRCSCALEAYLLLLGSHCSRVWDSHSNHPTSPAVAICVHVQHRNPKALHCWAPAPSQCSLPASGTRNNPRAVLNRPRPVVGSWRFRCPLPCGAADRRHLNPSPLTPRAWRLVRPRYPVGIGIELRKFPIRSKLSSWALWCADWRCRASRFRLRRRDQIRQRRGSELQSGGSIQQGQTSPHCGPPNSPRSARTCI